ncbi:hypothetical protein EYF80_007548 [Liparis tanakae]|uniref:Uncharacterized protein n=1 Tax=Liparis tanakae TaxID=230148 RepID=A0A4Z2IW51_9TELE|nr:hypothetical protein EYF80_007548 [Liparis tanakae]
MCRHTGRCQDCRSASREHVVSRAIFLKALGRAALLPTELLSRQPSNYYENMQQLISERVTVVKQEQALLQQEIGLRTRTGEFDKNNLSSSEWFSILLNSSQQEEHTFQNSSLLEKDVVLCYCSSTFSRSFHSNTESRNPEPLGGWCWHGLSSVALGHRLSPVSLGHRLTPVSLGHRLTPVSLGHRLRPVTWLHWDGVVDLILAPRVGLRLPGSCDCLLRVLLGGGGDHGGVGAGRYHSWKKASRRPIVNISCAGGESVSVEVERPKYVDRQQQGQTQQEMKMSRKMMKLPIPRTMGNVNFQKLS